MAKRVEQVHENIGQRIRLLRTSKGLTMKEASSIVGVSFQQMQKYESGVNRMPSSKLNELSKALSVDINYFFNDSELINNFFTKEDSDIFLDPEVMELVRLFSKIEDISMRKKIIKIIKSII